LDLYWVAGDKAGPFYLQQTTPGSTAAFNRDIRWSRQQ
jgi:hypothetical protein